MLLLDRAFHFRSHSNSLKSAAIVSQSKSILAQILNTSATHRWQNNTVCWLAGCLWM